MNLATLERKQRQLIIHSFIYYNLNDNIWPDSKWDKTAKEVLTVLVTPLAARSKWFEVFKGFDGCTGYGLVSYQWVKEIDSLNTLSYQHHFSGLAEYLVKVENINE